MSLTFVSVATPTPFTSVNTISAASAIGPLGDLIMYVIAVENVAAGSGPWVAPNTTTPGTAVIGPATGWEQVLYQAPSATGVGLEVWAAIEGVTSPQGNRIINLVSTLSGSVVCGKWSGPYAPTGLITDGAIRSSAKQQWTGNSPQSPAVTPQSGDLVVPVGAMTMTTPGFGTPTGSGSESAYTSRTDAARSGFGTAEAVIGDAQALVAGTTGAITWPGSASPSSAKGAMGTIVVRPAPLVPTSAGLVIDFTYPLT